MFLYVRYSLQSFLRLTSQFRHFVRSVPTLSPDMRSESRAVDYQDFHCSDVHLLDNAALASVDRVLGLGLEQKTMYLFR